MTDLLNKCYRLNNPPCIAESIDDDAVLIDLDSGTYHSIRGFSGQVWVYLSNGVTPQAILDSVSDEAEKKLEFKNKLSSFVQALLDQGLLAVSSESKPMAEQALCLPENCSLEFDSYTDMQELLSLDPIHDADEEMGWPKEKALQL